MFKQLSSILEKSLALHQQLLALMEKKREVVISGQVSGLQALLKDETALIEQMAEVEQERLSYVQEMIPTSRDAERVTISYLMAQMDEQDRTVIQRQMKALLHLIDQLKRENDYNQTLVRETLQHTQHTLNVLTVSPTEDYLYNPLQRSASESKGTSGLFDRKA